MESFVEPEDCYRHMQRAHGGEYDEGEETETDDVDEEEVVEWQEGEEILGDDGHVVGRHFWVGRGGVNGEEEPLPRMN